MKKTRTNWKKKYEKERRYSRLLLIVICGDPVPDNLADEFEKELADLARL